MPSSSSSSAQAARQRPSHLLNLGSGSVIAQHYRQHRHQEFLRFLELIHAANTGCRWGLVLCCMSAWPRKQSADGGGLRRASSGQIRNKDTGQGMDE